jgi:hypothetical protein
MVTHRVVVVVDHDGIVRGVGGGGGSGGGTSTGGGLRRCK